MDTNTFSFMIFYLYSLSYYVDGSGTVTGGVSEVENKKDRSYYASKALQELEKSSDNSNARKIVEITKVESQVVAGVKYTVTLILATTNCKKGIPSEKLEVCEENTNLGREECEITIWEKPWMNFLEVQKQSCKPYKNENDQLPLFGTNMINHRRG